MFSSVTDTNCFNFRELVFSCWLTVSYYEIFEGFGFVLIDQ